MHDHDNGLIYHFLVDIITIISLVILNLAGKSCLDYWSLAIYFYVFYRRTFLKKTDTIQYVDGGFRVIRNMDNCALNLVTELLVRV